MTKQCEECLKDLPFSYFLKTKRWINGTQKSLSVLREKKLFLNVLFSLQKLFLVANFFVLSSCGGGGGWTLHTARTPLVQPFVWEVVSPESRFR